MNKKIIIVMALIMFTFFNANTQTTITLQPGAADGKDGYLDSKNSSNNYGSHIDFPAIAWTNGGTPVDGRGLIDFDLSDIPCGATINSALLSLYSYNSPANGSHSTMSGSNESVICRVTSSWLENTVTWNNQPSTTTQNQVSLPASTSSIQHYLDIDVTDMVQDMIDDANNSYGFLLKLVTEDYYRKLIFASSDNSDSSLHPKLVVTYTADSDCITLQPDSYDGKDAVLDSYMSSVNFGNDPQFVATAFNDTNRREQLVRSVLEFRLPEIPCGATIDSVMLSLDAWASSAGYGSHTTNGSNECYIQRITSYWDESTVTWDNQPSTTTQNQVWIPPSSSPNQNYYDIDVTNLVKDMYGNPMTSFGFMLKLRNEFPHRVMNFASSDHTFLPPPRLDICYSFATIPNKSAMNNSTVIETVSHNLEFNLYPNPANGTVNVSVISAESGKVTIEIINSQGQIVEHLYDAQPLNTIDVSSLTKGIYFVKIQNNQSVITKKLLVN